jgi:CysZ protein
MENPKPLKFLDGVRAYGAGLKFIVLKPSNWPLAVVPALVALTLSAASFAGLYSLSRAWLESSNAEHAVAAALLTVLVAMVCLIVSVVLGFALAQPISGFALDGLARRKEAELGLRAADSASAASQFFRSLRVTLFALCASLPLLALLSVVTLLVPPAAVVTLPLKIAVSSFAIAWDMLDYPLAFRGMSVRDRITFCTKHKAAVFALGLFGSVSLLVPGVGLLLLPIGVVGATQLVAVALPRAE